MNKKLSLFIIGLIFLSGFLITESGLAYYYPPSNIPPGPPPNYNQVDTTYFLGTPELPLPPPDSGGLYVYYDQGAWNIANHIYSKGNSLEQFHCCVLAAMDQPPTLGVNVFIEEFELWGDTTNSQCLKQNDRWGWIPWGDGLYEIWWDVTTREWKHGEGDLNDFMRFRIAGSAIDFNFWSSGHAGPFDTDQIFLGANKTPLSSVPGFTDTYPGINDPYQSQAGSDPTSDPNITIFTFKYDTLRSYNKNGLIDSTDSYTCNLALEYGERYAGSFAYEGDGVEFSTTPLSPPNHDPNIFITPDTSVFLCDGDSVRIWIFASDPDPDDTITVEKTYGIGTYDPETDLTPISDEFYFHPDTSGVYMFIFRVTDNQGATGEDTTLITVSFNQAPQLTCPDDDIVHAGNTFISSDFSVLDPDGNLSAVAILNTNPTPTNNPTIVDNHIEWVTTCAESGVYTIGLVATDSCGVKDTCYFQVTVYNQPPVLTCPNNGSVHAGNTFTSSNFSFSDPEGDPTTVTFLDITPGATNSPTVVSSHVEWLTTCAEDGDYTIRLVATDSCGAKDTCQFTVNVYNQPPVLTCPENDSINAGDLLISTDYYVSDPDDASGVIVTLHSIWPTPTNPPTLVDNHIEWLASSDDLVNGPDFTITLIATDPCEAPDTCQFIVTVYNLPPIIVPPEDDSVHAGDYFVSTDFSVSDPKTIGPVTVSLCGVTPPPTHMPTIVDSHVEWQTECDEAGNIFTICLEATDSCGAKDTCYFEVTVYNQPPVLTCPNNGSVHVGDTFTSGDFSFSDPEGDPTTVAFLDITPTATNSPTVVSSHVEWITTCAEDGDYTIRLVATDSCGLEDTCQFTVNVYNQPPQLTCPNNGGVPAGSTFVSTNFSVIDPDGDPTVVTLLGITPLATNDPIIVGNHVEWVTTSAENGYYIITLRATDGCGLNSDCSFVVTVMGISDSCSNVLIPETDCVNPGDYATITIWLDNNTTPFGGFELEVEFDNRSMCFVSADPGECLAGFELFTYRMLPCCLYPPCWKYKILLFGMYDIPNGAGNIGDPIPMSPAGEYHPLAHLNFVVANDENLRGYLIPVCFEWEGTVVNDVLVEDWNCEENTFSSWSGDTLYTSNLLCQFKADLCDLPTDRIQPIIIFQYGVCGQNCGGIDVCPAGPGECKRGDVNYNDMTYEVADAVLFASYFVEGLSMFRYNQAYQICATDVNADGRALTLADLVYLIRVILHDAAEIPKLAPSSEVANVIVYNNTITTECTSPIGAILFEFDGAVAPTLLADNMEMVNKDNKVLVWSKNGHVIESRQWRDEVLSFAPPKAGLVSVTAVGYDTHEISTSIIAKVAPSAFALNPAYPNPFNPYTNLSFTLPEAAVYSLKIYNVAGQLVRSYEGSGSVGLNVISWNGQDNAGDQVASGLYFYKLTAGSFSATQKMVMMK